MSLTSLSPLSDLNVTGVTTTTTQRSVQIQPEYNGSVQYTQAPSSVKYVQGGGCESVRYIQSGGCEAPTLSCPPKTMTEVRQVQIPQKAVCVPCGEPQPVQAACAPAQNYCGQPAAAACGSSGYWGGWGALAQFLLWFIILTILFWLVYYSLRPGFVLVPGTTTVDTGKVLLAAVITAFIVILIVWLIWVLVSRC